MKYTEPNNPFVNPDGRLEAYSPGQRLMPFFPLAECLNGDRFIALFPKEDQGFIWAEEYQVIQAAWMDTGKGNTARIRSTLTDAEMTMRGETKVILLPRASGKCLFQWAQRARIIDCSGGELIWYRNRFYFIDQNNASIPPDLEYATLHSLDGVGCLVNGYETCHVLVVKPTDPDVVRILFSEMVSLGTIDDLIRNLNRIHEEEVTHARYTV